MSWMLGAYKNGLREGESWDQMMRLAKNCIVRYEEQGDIKWLEEARGFLTLELAKPNHPKLV